MIGVNQRPTSGWPANRAASAPTTMPTPTYPCQPNERMVRARAGRRRRRDRLSHAGEIDGEAPDVAAVAVADDQRDALVTLHVPGREAVDAAGEIGAVVLAYGGPLVLDEARLDLAVAD